MSATSDKSVVKTLIDILILGSLFLVPALADESSVLDFDAELQSLGLIRQQMEQGRHDLAEAAVEGYLNKNPLSYSAIAAAEQIYSAQLDTDKASVFRRMAAWLRQKTNLKNIPLSEQEEQRIRISKIEPENARRVLVELNASPQSQSVLWWVAKAKGLRLLGEFSESLSAIHHAMVMDPDNDLVRLEAAAYWEGRGRLNRAAEHLAYLLAIQPTNASAFYRFARVQFLRQRGDLAAETLRVRQILFPKEQWPAQARERMVQAMRANERAETDQCKRSPASQEGQVCSQ